MEALRMSFGPVQIRRAAPLVLFCALFLLTTARPTYAESISMTFKGIASGTQVSGPDGGSAGVMQWQGSTTSLSKGNIGLFPGLAAQPGVNINTFCIDPTRDLASPDKYDVVYATPSTISSWDSVPDINGRANVATEILELFGTFFTGLDIANNPKFGGHGTSGTAQYGAFQDAIWILEGFTINNALANYFVNNLGSTKATNVVILSSTLDDGRGQNQITVIDPVPAPSGALLALIGFTGLAGYRFRVRRILAR
jgi:hypothetical protein